MAKDIFQINFKNGGSRKGLAWTIEEPNANLVIITGMLEHSDRYDDFAKFMNSNGYNVYCLDCYGQGLNVSEDLSDYTFVPKNAFNMMADELHELVLKLNVSCKPIYLLGHSMGSFMAQDFIEKYPNDVKKVVLSGTSGKQFAYPLGGTLAKMFIHKKGWNKQNKMFCNLSLGASVKSVKNRKTDCDWLSYNEENVTKYVADPLCGGVASGGFYHEFLIMLSNIFKGKNTKRVSKDMEVLIVGGAEDSVGLNGKGPETLNKQYSKLGLKRVEKIIYDHMRHEILNETEKEMVYNDIKEFLA